MSNDAGGGVGRGVDVVGGLGDVGFVSTGGVVVVGGELGEEGFPT